jgi:hypothetical protein
VTTPAATTTTARLGSTVEYMDAVVFASRTGVRLELVSAPDADPGHATLPARKARLVGAGVDASVRCPEAAWEPRSLADFLAALAQDWKGWEGERVWQSAEVEMRLTARHEKANTVIVEVVMEDGAPPRWRCEAELELDPGAFQQLAADARRLGETSLTR